MKDTKEYKDFIKKVKQNLTLDNYYVEMYEPNRDTYEEYRDDDGKIVSRPYYIDNEEATEIAVNDLLDDDNMFAEFLLDSVPEYLELLKKIIKEEVL